MRVGPSTINSLYQGAQGVSAVRRGQNEVFSNFDPSSVEFFSRAGVTNFAAKTKIDNFVVYCKTNLISRFWDKLYCFPLIASQNPNLQPLGGLVNLGVPVPGITLLGGVQTGGRGLNFSPPEVSRLATFDINGNGLENATAFTMFVATQIKSAYIPSRSSFFSAKNNSWSVGQPAANAGLIQVFRNQEIATSVSGMNTGSPHNLYCFSVKPISTGVAPAIYHRFNDAFTYSFPLTLPATPLDSSFCIGSDGASTLTTNGSFDGEISFVGVIKDYTLAHYYGSYPDPSAGTSFYNQLKDNLLSQVLG